jgi:AcrR family transcriptional regulator
MAPARTSRRPELVDLARSVLVDEGLDRFVLRNIAARAGMTVGNLQYYFPTRDDLLTAVIEAEFDRDLAAIRGVVAETGAGGLTTIAQRLVGNWCDGGSSVFAALSLLAFHHERFRLLNREIYTTFYAELGTVIRAADPEADDAEVAARARLITALLDGVAIQIHAAVAEADACEDLLARATAHLVTLARGGTP